MLAGHVVIGDYARVGGNSAVAERVRLGEHCFVGGQSGIDRDIPPFCVAFGNRPKRLRGCNVRALRRRYGRASLHEIRAIVATWMDRRLTCAEAAARIAADYGSSAFAARFLAFLKHTHCGVLR
jgi:UDP-N-acetylglucosamine acyltransferase